VIPGIFTTESGLKGDQSIGLGKAGNPDIRDGMSAKVTNRANYFYFSYSNSICKLFYAVAFAYYAVLGLHFSNILGQTK